MVSQGPEIQLQYRPTVTYAAAGLQNGQAVNDIRIYIVNLNSSDPIALQGDLPLQISCTSTQLTTQTYQVSYQPENLVITSQLNGANGSVSIPISSTSEGAIIHVETVISNVSIERWIQVNNGDDNSKLHVLDFCRPYRWHNHSFQL